VKLGLWSFGFLHRVVVDGSDVSEERTAFIFRVTESGSGGAEVVGRKRMCLHVQSLKEIWSIGALEGYRVIGS
jgi:hypothetical protein